jgi:carboxylesterase type B
MSRFNGNTSLNGFKQLVARKREFHARSIPFQFIQTSIHSTASIPGAIHGDDFFYYFKTYLKPAPAIESIEFQLIKIMVDIITSFAITGTPTISNQLTWNPVNKTDEVPKLLNINNDGLSVIQLPEYSNIKVFNDIFKEAKVDLI